MRLFSSVLVAVLVSACVDAPPQLEPPVPTGTAVPVTRVSVTPESVLIVVGATAQLRALESVVAGQPVESTFVWRSDNASVATVDSTGALTAHAAGHATVIANDARAPTVQGSASITVVRLTSGSIP